MRPPTKILAKLLFSEAPASSSVAGLAQRQDVKTTKAKLFSKVLLVQIGGELVLAATNCADEGVKFAKSARYGTQRVKNSVCSPHRLRYFASISQFYSTVPAVGHWFRCFVLFFFSCHIHLV